MPGVGRLGVGGFPGPNCRKGARPLSARSRLVSKHLLLHSQNMNNSERIADFIRRFPGRDDDEISAATQIEPRQTVNQVCRALAKSGVVERRRNPTGKLGNYPLDSSNINRVAPFSGTEAPGAEAVTVAIKDVVLGRKRHRCCCEIPGRPRLADSIASRHKNERAWPRSSCTAWQSRDHGRGERLSFSIVPRPKPGRPTEANEPYASGAAMVFSCNAKGHAPALSTSYSHGGSGVSGFPQISNIVQGD